MGKYICLLFLMLLVGDVLTAPKSLVVSSSELSNTSEKEIATMPINRYPKLYQIDITTNISNRFATTLVVNKVKNVGKVAKETTFTVVLPEKAFISEFAMEIGGKSYKAHVKEKDEANRMYKEAVDLGQSAGHVAVNTRDSNKFTVSVNVEPETKVVFLLKYEELLERRNEQYELILNIHPRQILKNLNVKIQINESRPLKFVRTPSLRSGNEISTNEEKLVPSSHIEKINSTTAVVRFNPDPETQKQFGLDLGNKDSNGLCGQFVVQFDVERDPNGGEVLLRDGYFVHFFAPEDLQPLPKHVLFVLDSSKSMEGREMNQLKDAMHSILEEIKESDLISIIDFGTDVYVWEIVEESRKIIPLNNVNFENPFTNLSQLNLPSSINALKENIVKAKRVINKLSSSGKTCVIGGLEVALYLAKVTQQDVSENKHQPLIIFLTDGEPNAGLSSEDEIVKIVTRLNVDSKVPIFSVSFGEKANKDFLRKLSLKNQGFSRHIYEASDASLQLQEFFKEVSCPLLSNVTFTYNGDVKEISKTTFPVYFKGSEIVVAGQYNVSDQDLPTYVIGWDTEGRKLLNTSGERPVSSLERMWAYLTVKRILDERDLSDNTEELTNKALDLALKYSFVTDITSLVVVKPNENSTVNTKSAFHVDKENGANSRLFPDDVKVSYENTNLSSLSLQDGLPWLTLNPNGTLTVAGKSYELEEKNVVTVPKPCSDNLGDCVFLKDCSQMYWILEDFKTYLKYFCPIGNRYAGICCPKE